MCLLTFAQRNILLIKNFSTKINLVIISHFRGSMTLNIPKKIGEKCTSYKI